MIMMEIIGRLVADSEVRTFNDGTRYITMRIASEDPTVRNQNNVVKTAYVNASSSATQHVMMQKYLTKGKPVFLRGYERSKAYINDKTKQAEIGYNIKITELNFIPSDASVGARMAAQQQPMVAVPQQQMTPQQPQQMYQQGQMAAPMQQAPQQQVYNPHVVNGQPQVMQQPQPQYYPQQQLYPTNNDPLPF